MNTSAPHSRIANARFHMQGAVFGAAAASLAAYGLFKTKEKTMGEQISTYMSKKEVQERHDRYLELLKTYPDVLGPMGDAHAGEIQIVTGRARIKQIEEETGQKVGILAENKWQIWVCDAVEFPNGTKGIYGRFLWKQSLKGPSGAAVLPIMPNGKILLISIYRHPLRKWVLEIPRGNGEGAEVINAIVKRELKEETGAEVSSIVQLGKMNADSGITTGGIPIVKAQIARFGDHNRDPAEASICLHAFTKKELEDGIRAGFMEIKINGKTEKVEVGTDSFMLAALELDRLKTE